MDCKLLVWDSDRTPLKLPRYWITTVHLVHVIDSVLVLRRRNGVQMLFAEMNFYATTSAFGATAWSTEVGLSFLFLQQQSVLICQKTCAHATSRDLGRTSHRRRTSSDPFPVCLVATPRRNDSLQLPSVSCMGGPVAWVCRLPLIVCLCRRTLGRQ